MKQPDILVLSTNGHRSADDYQELWRNPTMNERMRYFLIAAIAFAAWLIYYFVDQLNDEEGSSESS